MDVIPWIGENLPEHLRECDKDAVMFYGQFRRMSWGVDYMAWQAIDEEGKCMGIGGVLKEWLLWRFPMRLSLRRSGFIGG